MSPSPSPPPPPVNSSPPLQPPPAPRSSSPRSSSPSPPPASPSPPPAETTTTTAEENENAAASVPSPPPPPPPPPSSPPPPLIPDVASPTTHDDQTTSLPPLGPPAQPKSPPHPPPIIMIPPLLENPSTSGSPRSMTTPTNNYDDGGQSEMTTVLLDGPPVISRSMSKRSLLRGPSLVEAPGSHHPHHQHHQSHHLLFPHLHQQQPQSQLNGSQHSRGLGSSTCNVLDGLSTTNSTSASIRTKTTALPPAPPFVVSPPSSLAGHHSQQHRYQHAVAQAHLSKEYSIYLHHPLQRRPSQQSSFRQQQQEQQSQQHPQQSHPHHHQRIWSEASSQHGGDKSTTSIEEEDVSLSSSLAVSSSSSSPQTKTRPSPWYKFWGGRSRKNKGTILNVSAAPVYVPPSARALLSPATSIMREERVDSAASVASVVRRPPAPSAAGGGDIIDKGLDHEDKKKTATLLDGGEKHGSKDTHTHQDEEDILADELVNNIEHAKKAMAYQSEFIRSLGMSSQLLQFLQINATILSFRVSWPPALERLIKVFQVFLFNFEIFHFKYTALVVCSLFPFLCYYFSEIFWKNSALWRRRYIYEWVHEKTLAWNACTFLVIVTGLICAALVSFGQFAVVDAFSVTWAVSLTALLLYGGFVGLGNVSRKLFIILENDTARINFFLSIRYWARYLVLVALNLGYLPILGKLFKYIYKAKAHHHGDGPLKAEAPWIVAVILCVFYGVGMPFWIYTLLVRRRRLYEWVPDPIDVEDGGKYELKAEAGMAIANPGSSNKSNKEGRGEATEAERERDDDHHTNDDDDDDDDDAIACSFLTLEQQVYNLRDYSRSMPLITNNAKREALLRRVKSSLREKQAAAVQSRNRSVAVYELAQGNPIDDYWKPLKPQFFWWKILVYYVERGFLVGLVVTQEGHKVAKTLSCIIASFLAIGLTALALIVCQPYNKRKENCLETFFDIFSAFNIAIALCLNQRWLHSESGPWVAYLILVPNLLVLVVAIYIMSPRSLLRAVRFKYRQFLQRTREHREREREMANRESRALFDASFKGDVERVKALLEQGRADVRYEKPKDVKPLGFANYTPTQIAVYMGKHECLELLLQHHTLFAEEEIVKSTKAFSRHGLFFYYLVVPVSTAFSYLMSPSKVVSSASSSRPFWWTKKKSGTHGDKHTKSTKRLSDSNSKAAAAGGSVVTPITEQEQEEREEEGEGEGEPGGLSPPPPKLSITKVSPNEDDPKPPLPPPPTLTQDGSLIRYPDDQQVQVHPTGSTGNNSDHNPRHRLLARHHGAGAGAHHNKWQTRTDSMAMDAADQALFRCTVGQHKAFGRGAVATTTAAGFPGAVGSGAAVIGPNGDGHHRHHHSSNKHSSAKDGGEDDKKQEFFSLLGLAFCSWSRDCLDLLLTYGSVVGSTTSTATTSTTRLISTLRKRLYAEASESPMDVKLRLTAAAALHHPRDLQWILDPERGVWLEKHEKEDDDTYTTYTQSSIGTTNTNGNKIDVFGFLTRVFRKVKHDQRSTKDMKVRSMKALVEEVAAKRVTGTATLRLDLSYFGVDDYYLDHILHVLWDITATGLPTNLLLEGNALTDYGVRLLVLKLRENMPATLPVSSSAAQTPRAGLGGGAGGTGTGALSPLSAGGSHHSAVHSGLAGSLAVERSFLSTNGGGGGGGAASQHAASIVGLNLSGNDVGTDGALFLADLILDTHAMLRHVTVFKIECSLQSPRSLAYDRVQDRSLSLDNALVVAIIVDAYAAVREEQAAAAAVSHEYVGFQPHLHSGGGGGGGHLPHPSQQQHPPQESAVKQILAMGEKEGWRKRLGGGCEMP